jgi:MYXO-CTERM domain-containing protein
MGSTEIRIAGLALGLGIALLGPHERADAMCGCMVAEPPPARDVRVAQLESDATNVVLMREGTRTVLSMQTNYRGRPEDFAMVIPVPVVLQQSDVKTLPDELFDRIDRRTAPQLVEYWEQDPCNPYGSMGGWGMAEAMPTAAGGPPPSGKGRAPAPSVTIEAQFEVDEYQIVILSAKDSTGLEKWLERENYAIPDGAEPLLRPYVQSGSKFFVAKVDAKKVRFDENGQAKLSPLRFHYDSPEFSLPVRLGLINAPTGPGAKQDLIIHILARNTRYELANYDNVTIPTNLDVDAKTRDDFASFYASLFDHVLANNPRAIVTEYAGMAAFCQTWPSCPEPELSPQELYTLGADVLPGPGLADGPLADGLVDPMMTWEFVLTRLHARYDATSLGEDLVFQRAAAIAGGREYPAADGKLERGAMVQPEGFYNDFQARYAIRHGWEGPVECANPQPGIWGDPWPGTAGNTAPVMARDLGAVDRNVVLANYVTEAAKQELETTVGKLPEGPSDPALREGGGAKSEPTSNGAPIVGYEGEGGCAHCSVERAGAGGALAFGLGLLGVLGLRRRRFS